MRIGVVAPYIKRIHGNRLAFALARGLALENEVTLYAHTIFRPLVAPVGEAIAPGRFQYLRITDSPAFRNRTLLALQILRGRDRALARFMLDDHRRRSLDAIVLVANEGHWIGEYVRRWPAPGRPQSLICVMDLLDHVFLQARERSMPLARQLMSWAYPAVHCIAGARFRSFDHVGAISEWDGELLRSLYGIQPEVNVAAVALDRFRPTPVPPQVDRPFIAVPTVSVPPTLRALLLGLHRRGLPMISFGPCPIGEIPYRGFVSDSELVELLSAAAATLFLFDYEALGLLPLESLAVGTPVVTLPKGGVRSELLANPFVTFATDMDSIDRACRGHLASPKTVEATRRCRLTVGQYDPTVVAHRITGLLSHPSATSSGELAGIRNRSAAREALQPPKL